MTPKPRNPERFKRAKIRFALGGSFCLFMINALHMKKHEKTNESQKVNKIKKNFKKLFICC